MAACGGGGTRNTAAGLPPNGLSANAFTWTKRSLDGTAVDIDATPANDAPPGLLARLQGAAGGMDDLLTSKMSGEELEKLLKQGAYAVLGDNTEEESARYFEQDIETLLKTSAREIVHNPEGLQSAQL